MIRSFTASTAEIDDVEAAVSELFSLLDCENNLLKNSVGIVSFYSEFSDTGVLSALAEKLPFPVVGTTTLATGTQGMFGQFELGIIVFTSDDVEFEAVLSGSLSERLDEPIEKMYAEAVSGHAKKPALMLTFAPLIFQYAGDLYVELLDKLSGGVPNFGTLAVDHNTDYHEAATIFNGEVHKDKAAVVLFFGEVEAEFHIVSMPRERIMKQMAVVTESDGNILKSINNKPISDYFETMGLAKNGVINEGAFSVPYAIDYNDSTPPVSRSIFALTPEGYGVVGGLMPEGTTLLIGGMNKNDVINTTEGKIEEVLSAPENKVLLMYSCIGRSLALGADILAELECVQEKMGDSVPYLISYSGGEICPVYGESGAKNRFHNNTLVICAIKG